MSAKKVTFSPDPPVVIYYEIEKPIAKSRVQPKKQEDLKQKIWRRLSEDFPYFSRSKKNHLMREIHAVLTRNSTNEEKTPLVAVSKIQVQKKTSSKGINRQDYWNTAMAVNDNCKNDLCVRWKRGHCHYGNFCMHAHGFGDKNCWNWVNKNRVCRHGAECWFAHRPVFYNTRE